MIVGVLGPLEILSVACFMPSDLLLVAASSDLLLVAGASFCCPYCFLALLSGEDV